MKRPTSPIDLFTSPRFMAAMLFVAWVLVAAALLTRYELLNMSRNGQAPSTPEETNVACTMDAMICPDGSAVGRIAPNCEFAPCPSPGLFKTR